MSESPKNQKEVLKRAPTLYVIIAFKILKGLLCVAIAIMVYNLSDNDLPTDYENLLHKLGLNADRKFWSDLAVKVGNLTERGMVHFAVGTLIYSLFSLVEGVGMMFRVSWAGWLAISESIFFIPLEVRRLMDKFSWPVAVILLVNVFIVWYLYRNRETLFRHHHRH
jgi:uncharacterized membrane protein (DUF2068 family)